MARGVIKRLILDRVFLDGAKIAAARRIWAWMYLIPVRKDMDNLSRRGGHGGRRLAVL